MPTKPDGQTDIRTDIQADISIYRIASLLKRVTTLRFGMPVNFDIEEGTVERMAVEPLLSLKSPATPSELYFCHAKSYCLA